MSYLKAPDQSLNWQNNIFLNLFEGHLLPLPTLCTLVQLLPLAHQLPQLGQIIQIVCFVARTFYHVQRVLSTFKCQQYLVL